MIVEVSHCRSCGSGTHADDRYCQECGTFLDISGGDPDPMSSQFESDDFLARLSPRAAKPVVALPVVAGIIVAVALVPLLIYFINNSYQTISANYLQEEVVKDLNQGRASHALEILDRIALTHKLTSTQQQLLNTACFHLADDLIAASHYNPALLMLSRISPDFPQYDQVKERSQVCRDYLAPQEVVSKNNSGARTHTRARAHIAVMTPPPRVISVAPPTAPESPGISAPKKAPDRKPAQVASAPIRQPSANVSAGSTQKPDATAGVNNQGAGLDNSVRLDANDNDRSASSSKAIPSYAHNDVVRYNELLAAYFSSKHGAGKEPPSINEWVHLGRPKF